MGMKVKQLVYDVRTKKLEEREVDIELPRFDIGEPLDLTLIKKLISYAKKQGWI